MKASKQLTFVNVKVVVYEGVCQVTLKNYLLVCKGNLIIVLYLAVSSKETKTNKQTNKQTFLVTIYRNGILYINH